MSTLTNQIPLIDFADFLGDNSSDRSRVTEQIYQACHEIGFMYLKNLNIEQELIEKMFAQSQHFFSLPLEAKNQVAWRDEISNRGYVGLERERLDESKPGDYKEAFNVGKEIKPEEINESEQSSLVLNQWSEGEEEFRQTVLQFYDACADAAEQVCQAFAIALDLPENFFADKHDNHDYTLRLLHYPPLANPLKPEQARAGTHSDYGSFTLLFQDQVGGLEVRTATGEWINAPSLPGTVVVNTGDLMQRWTNHVFCSTKHRVGLPTSDRSQRSRYSIAFFCHPNYDATINCLNLPESERSPYPPIKAGEYLLSRLQATY